MDIKILRNQISHMIEDATAEELQALLRVLTPNVRLMPLRYKSAGQTSAYIELPADIAEGVKVMVRSHFPERALQWDNGQSDLEKDIERRLERMRKG